MADASGFKPGKLRFKGDKAKDAGVKKKKKKSTKPEHVGEALAHALETAPAKDDEDDDADPAQKAADADADQSSTALDDALDRFEEPKWMAGLTAAQKAHEYHKMELRKRDLGKTSAKSHRQKVEEFNAYLSRLSEHNDMPRIGPG